jgi:phage FluMu gp28-like protein
MDMNSTADIDSQQPPFDLDAQPATPNTDQVASNTEHATRNTSNVSPAFSLPKTFLPYQRRWIEDPSPRRLMVKSRQIGISWATAYDIVRKTARDLNRYDAWVSSRDEFQAKLFADDCVEWACRCHRHAMACPDIRRGVIDSARNISAHQLPFHNGRSIYSLSSSPDAQAGKRGRRVFDEFALNPENRLLYSTGQPGAIWGGGIDIISTHRGTANFFNELVSEIKFQGNPKGFSLHTVTILDAVRDGLLDKLKSVWRQTNSYPAQLDWTDDDFLQNIRDQCADEETWLQEYLCQPGDDNSAFLSYDLISSCQYPPGTDLEQKPTEEAKGKTSLPSLDSVENSGPLFVGVDVGRDRDLTVIWVLERVGVVLHTRALECLDRQSFDSQEAVLYQILRLPNIRRCCIDQTGLGRQFAERAIRKFGGDRVEGIHFTGAAKEQLAYPVRAAFEDRSIRIPNDKLLRADLRCIRKTTTTSGNIRFTGERNPSGHADRFWALALALHAAEHQPPCYSATLC